MPTAVIPTTLAQQLIDASGDGDLAFVAMAIMCFLFVAILFGIDVVRKRRSGDE